MSSLKSKLTAFSRHKLVRRKLNFRKGNTLILQFGNYNDGVVSGYDPVRGKITSIYLTKNDGETKIPCKPSSISDEGRVYVTPANLPKEFYVYWKVNQ